MFDESSSRKRRNHDGVKHRSYVDRTIKHRSYVEEPDRLLLLPDDAIAVMMDHLTFFEVVKLVSTRKNSITIYTDQWWQTWFAKRSDNMHTLAVVIFKHTHRYINILLAMSVDQWVDKPLAMHRLLCSSILLPEDFQPLDPHAAREFVTIADLNAHCQQKILQLPEAHFHHKNGSSKQDALRYLLAFRIGDLQSVELQEMVVTLPATDFASANEPNDNQRSALQYLVSHGSIQDLKTPELQEMVIQLGPEMFLDKRRSMSILLQNIHWLLTPELQEMVVMLDPSHFHDKPSLLRQQLGHLDQWKTCALQNMVLRLNAEEFAIAPNDLLLHALETMVIGSCPSVNAMYVALMANIRSNARRATLRSSHR